MTSQERMCPCGSGRTYRECCEPYHKGLQNPPDALSLMKSRYSAYALCDANYIISTTHPKNPYYEKDLLSWRKGIEEFGKNTQFVGLEILEVLPERKDGIAIVTFKATLKRNGQDASFTERSYFAKIDGKWLYLNGDILEGQPRS